MTPASRLEGLLGRAKLIIGFERLWPSAVSAAFVIGLFVAVSWLGLWLLVPVWARIAGVAGFVAALAVPVAMAVRARLGTREEALARLDRDSGRKHRPFSSSQDRLADARADPLTHALWALHRRRTAEAAAGVRLAPPSPRLVDRDVYALRALALVAVTAAGFVAGSDKEGRVASAFAWRSAVSAGAGFRLDAWIDPPPYTGLAPVLLSGSPGQPAPDPRQETAAPVNSTLVVRSSGEGKVDIETDGGLKDGPAPNNAAKAAAASGETGLANVERRFVLAGDGHLAVSVDGVRRAIFALRAIPDAPPTVALSEKPKSNLRGSLTLAYRVEDDYGVLGLDAVFTAPVRDGKPLTGRSLVEPPKLPLGLPNGARGLGPGQSTVDLSAHPWAGAEATLVLSARDEAGNVGLSRPVLVRLPTRPFHNPLARALVEQRQNLVFDPDHAAPVGEALDALAVAPELFGTTPAVFLGLTSARTRLQAARNDADLLGVADFLWSMALTVEDGDLSRTERDLRALQRELKEALARNAPPEEIKRLTEALKQQMEKLLAEMAQRDAAARDDRAPSDRDTRSITQKDLQALLDKMEQSARNGDMAEAQELLDQLQNILENMRSARRDEGSDPGAGRMKQSMSQLDRMMRDQQSLRDRTFKRGNQKRRGAPDRQTDGDQDPSADPGEEAQGGDGADPQAEAQDNSDLRGQQQKLRDALERMQKQMRDLGLDGEPGLGEAQRAMKDAEAALGQGGAGTDSAVEAQGRALQGLQQGARGLQGQMAQGRGQGEGRMPGEPGVGHGEGEADRDKTDPLGRERGNQGRSLDAQGVFNGGEGLAERARQVLDELRRRLGDRLRPQEEQDYLERLLQRY